MHLIIKYLQYIILLNLNYMVIFSHNFLMKKIKFGFNCYIFYALRNVYVDFEIREEICIILSNFKEVKVILSKISIV